MMETWIDIDGARRSVRSCVVNSRHEPCECMVRRERAEGCVLMALGMGLLLLVGIRNAWDLVTWIAPMRQNGPPS